MIEREIASTITSKGQVTLPAEGRRPLRVEVLDQIASIIDGDVDLRPGVVRRTARPGGGVTLTELEDCAEAIGASRDRAHRIGRDDQKACLD